MGSHVSELGLFVLAHARPIRTRKRVPAAHLYYLSRLHARVVLSVAPRQRYRWDHHRPAFVHAILRVAPPPQPAPCDGRQPRKARMVGYRHADRARVSAATEMGTPALPAVPQPVADVW